jgi:outer membrane protein OmpA-like peptidoglycan-associated protein
VDGSRLVGEIQEAFLSVAPDSAPPINICTVNFASIQFNALKYIKKIISPDNYTDPDTKTPRYLALFPAVTVDITNSGANCESRLSPEVAIDDDFEALKLTTILFDTDKSDIKPEFYQKLNRISEFLKKHPSIVLQIKGHTDIRGTADYNQELSLRRGASVGYFMEKTGVDSGRIQISGYGLTQPVADNQTDEGKSKNRRVDLVLVP